MTKKKLMMMFAADAAYPPREASADGGSMRGALGAWAETKTIGGYTWTKSTAKRQSFWYNV